MANDRMFIVNKATGKSIAIAKHYGCNWYSIDNLQEKLDEFFDELENFKSFHKDSHCYEIIYE